MKIAIIDIIGIPYDGTTVYKQGLGGSESAVTFASEQLAKLGFDVTVFNNCDSEDTQPGTYNGVVYRPTRDLAKDWVFDIVISSRTVIPFIDPKDYPKLNDNRTIPFQSMNLYDRILSKAKMRILWMHDTFCLGDLLIEPLTVQDRITDIFTLSDWHLTYITNCDHGARRNFEVLKPKVFITRNGVNIYDPHTDLKNKDPDLFVYNASVTKGMVPLVKEIWPRVKQQLPNAKLKIIGGYYRFGKSSAPDQQEQYWHVMANDPVNKNLDIEFTGVISQKSIAHILQQSSFMIYPSAFPETFGISSVESLCYNTPLITCRFGALEEIALAEACYVIDYSVVPNNLFPNINSPQQIEKFVATTVQAYRDRYLHQQKQNYCNIIKDIVGWDTVALQWKQHIYYKLKQHLPVDEYRAVQKINQRIHKIWKRRYTNLCEMSHTPSYPQQKIEIISPFYNAEHYLENHILSVAAQDYDNWEHTLIDDCSTDQSIAVIERTIASLPEHIQRKYKIVKRTSHYGAVKNQIETVRSLEPNSVVMLLDGDDSLTNDNSIFHYYNDRYLDGAEFTYGSCWSLADNIPLIAQEYPPQVKLSKAYRTHHFNWILPYTHLRTFRKRLLDQLDDTPFKDAQGEWYGAGGDGSVFYALIEQADPKGVIAVQDIMVNYNDVNPLNDYRVNATEQNKNAREIVKIIHKSIEKPPSKAYILKTSHPISQEYAQMAAESCDRVNLKWEYFNGIEGKTTSELFPNLNLTDKMSNAAACATASHFAIWRHILESRETAIILEHDSLMLHPVNIPIPDNKIITLGYKFKNIDIYDHRRAGPPVQIVDVSRHSGAHAYALSWKTCESLLKEIEQKGVTRAIDNFYFMRINQIGDTESSVPLAIADPTPAICWIRHSTIWKDPSTLNYELLPSFSKNIIQKKEMKKILIAIPTAKYIEPETFKSIYDLDVPEGYQTVFQYFYGYNIDQIRNLIADWVVKGYDYLLSVDSDIVLPRDTLTRFLAHDVDIVSGLYIQRKPGQHILEVYENNDRGGVSNIPYGKIKDKGLVPIGGCGFGCVLIKQSVFKGIPYPHFVYHSALDHANTISEDVDFCAKALKKGFKIYADTTMKCRHVGQSEFLIDDSIPAVDNSVELRLRDLSSQRLLPKPHVDYLQQLKDSGFTPKTIYDVGACVLHWTNEAKQIWPESTIIAFEAMPSCEFLYKENNMTYHVGVLSDTSGKTVEFYQNDQHPSGNSYYIENSDINPNSAFYFNETHKRTYQTVTLDAVFRLKQLPKPQLLYMDVQGAELDVLRGAEEVLESVEHVILELQSVEYNKGAPLREIVIQYMYTIGFELVAQFTNYGPDGDYHFKRR